MLKFEGLYTALVTPFTDDDQIDYVALERLLDEQMAAQVAGIVVLGSTGESATITDEEFKDIVGFVVKRCKNKVQILVGTGSNNTSHAIESSKLAQDLGADGLLMVTPYYNKPSQEGIFRHFSSVADAINIPIMLYNVQGRTGVNLQTSTLLRLSEHKNIVAVKEASGNIDQIMEVIASVPSDFSVLSGDDALTYPLMALGGHGIISVISNIIPERMNKMVNLLAQGNYNDSKVLHYKMLKLMNALLSVGSNPLAVKSVLAMQNRIKENFRLPLWKLDDLQQENLRKIFEECYND